MLKRALKRIIVILCISVMIVAIFVAVACIAGGFGAHSVTAKVAGTSIGFAIALGSLGVAYVVSDRDLDQMLGWLFIDLYINH